MFSIQPADAPKSWLPSPPITLHSTYCCYLTTESCTGQELRAWTKLFCLASQHFVLSAFLECQTWHLGIKGSDRDCTGTAAPDSHLRLQRYLPFLWRTNEKLKRFTENCAPTAVPCVSNVTYCQRDLIDFRNGSLEIWVNNNVRKSLWVWCVIVTQQLFLRISQSLETNVSIPLKRHEQNVLIQLC